MEHIKFVNEINEFFNRTGVKKTELAKHLDMDYKTIWRWLNGRDIACPSSMNHVRLFMRTWKPGRKPKAKGTK